jgi:hypothetical protein
MLMVHTEKENAHDRFHFGAQIFSLVSNVHFFSERTVAVA